MPRKKLVTRDSIANPIVSGLSINEKARTPDMPPTGSVEPLIYVVGDFPTDEDDREGNQFADRAGELLRAQMPKWITSKVRWNHAVRTRTVEGTMDRDPTQEEIDFYRPSLIKDIEDTKPKIVLAVGDVALESLLPGIGKSNLCRGRKFPAKFGEHTCWVMPIMSPSYILRIEKYLGGDIPGIEQKRCWMADIKAVLELAESDVLPEVITTEKFLSGEFVYAKYIHEVAAGLERLLQADEVAFDFETNAFRPYAEGARIICVSFSSGDFTLSIPIEPKEPVWSPTELNEVLGLLYEFWFTNDVTKTAHSSNFELEWLIGLYGKEIARKAIWDDTEAQSYVLDERLGGHDLDFCCRLMLGLPVKILSSINMKKIDSEPLDAVMAYNAKDAKSTWLLSQAQKKQIAKEGLTEVLKMQLERIPTLVLAQERGLPVSPEKVQEFSIKLGNQISEIKKKIENREEVQEFTTRFEQAYNPNSVQQTVKLLRDVIGIEAPARGKFSTDKESLATFDTPVAKLLLELRESNKLKSTYVDSMVIGDLVWPDGKIHCIFNATRTVTGRLSSKEPNLQNYPQRKNKEIRSQIVAGPGNVMVAIDLGQIESRVIAMASNDAFLMKATREGYDIHAEWATKLGKKYPKIAKKRGYDLTDPKHFKKFRSDLKNQLVFPLFYGSKPSALAARLEITDEEATEIYQEFWRQFPGVLRWQKEVMQNYREKHYVPTLTGRRRRAPMSTDMVINSAIQGTASDMVVDAMNRLSIKAEKENKPYLQAAINIHDDLTFIIPESVLEEAIEEIVNEMTTFSYPWITLPIEVEASVGPDWGSLQPIGKFETIHA